MLIRSALLLALLAGLAAPASAQQPPAPPPATVPPPATDPDITVTGRTGPPSPPLVGPAVFLSPMGEPYRSEDKLSGAEHWFVHADTDGNRRLTWAEFQADALRFFDRLDTDHDGVIGPIEIQHYETDIAPEVTVTSTYGDISKMSVDSDGKIKDPPYPTKLGAGRYSYVAAPEPIVAADADLDRGITKLEFLQAARRRFKALDLNGDGAITRFELPKLSAPRGGD